MQQIQDQTSLRGIWHVYWFSPCRLPKPKTKTLRRIFCFSLKHDFWFSLFCWGHSSKRNTFFFIVFEMIWQPQKAITHGDFCFCFLLVQKTNNQSLVIQSCIKNNKLYQHKIYINISPKHLKYLKTQLILIRRCFFFGGTIYV